MPALEDLITAGDVADGTHAHSGADVTSGTVPIARIPTGTTGSTVPFGNDARFTDSRTPLSHAASHASGGGDAVLPATASQAEMEAGTEAALRSVSPLRVAQAIAALAAGSGAQANLGTTTVGGNDESTTASRFWAKRVTPAANGQITGIAAHVKGTAAAVEFGIYAAIYDDNASVPQNIVAANFSGSANATSLRLNATYRWLWIPICYDAASGVPIWIVWGHVNWDTSALVIAYATSGSDYNGPATSIIGDQSISAATTTVRDYSLRAKIIT